MPPKPKKAIGAAGASGGERRGRGKPQHKPNDVQRAAVAELSAKGVPQEVIADLIGIDSKTLRARYRRELDEGIAQANAAVVGALFKAAVGGSVPAAKWWTQARLGWREPPRAVEMSGPNGGPIATKRVEDMDDDELIALAASDEGIGEDSGEGEG